MTSRRTWSPAATVLAAAFAAWNGTSWTPQPTPAPAAGERAAFSSVSCSSADSCTAVGELLSGSSPSALAETWNGSKWAFQAVAVPQGDPQSWLSDIVRTAADSCVAVGAYEPGSVTTDRALVERYAA